MSIRGVDLTVNKATVPNLNDKFGWISGAFDESDDRLSTLEQQIASLFAGIDASLIETGLLGLARGGTGANLSGTGGAKQVLKQLTAGGAITVATLAAAELSNGTTGTGKVVLQAAPTITGIVTLDSGVLIVVGSGSPENVVTAPVGSVYHRTNGGAGTSLYVKESGSGNTGWIGK